MNTALQFSSLIELPRTLVSYLLSNQLVAFNNGLLVNYGIESEQREELVRIQGELVFRTLQIEELPSALAQRLGITDETKLHDIAQDIYNEVCGPIRWYFPGLAARLDKTGFVLNASDLFPQPQPTTSLADAVTTVMTKMGDLPRPIKERVQTLVETTLREQQFDAEALRSQLLRPVTEGGIGIGEQNARMFLAQIKEFITLYKFNDVPDKNELTAVAKKPVQILDPALQPQDVLAPDEAADVEGATQAAREVSNSALSAQQESLVEAVLAADSLSDRSPEIQKRWRTIIEARIGGARDATKTRTLLAAPESAGGLGLNATEAGRLGDLLEQTASGFEKRREEFSVIEKIASVQKAAEGIMAGPEAAAVHNQKQLNERFVSMFGKSAVEEMRRETHREIESPEAAHPGEEARSHMAPINLGEAQAPVPVQQSAPISSATAPASSPTQDPKYVPKVPDKLKQLIDAENPIFPIKPKTPPVPVQKKSADIRPGMRLVGPIDELRIMSLVDFRRLSPDVSVRIQKIRSKIEIIGEDGPHEKIRAIQAFEQSDPVRLYRDLLKQSLIGGSTAEKLSEQYKSDGKEYLEPDEIAALRQFLAQIRYSSL